MNHYPIEIPVRGVCVKLNQILLCHTKNARNTYLPGGHVEFMESAADALLREMLEETGMSVRVGRFLGAVEHSFVQKGEKHCEINLLFEMDIPELSVDMDPPSLEDHIDLRWVSLKELSAAKLEPSTLRQALPRWIKNPGSVEYWSSTYKE